MRWEGAGGVFGEKLWKKGVGEGREFLEKAMAMYASLPYTEVCPYMLGTSAPPTAQDKSLWDSFLFS